MLQRIGKMPIVSRFGLAAVALLVLASLSTGVISALRQERGEEMTVSDAASEPRLPAIDAAAPVEFETATFALG